MAIQFTSKQEIIERLRKRITDKDSTAINTLMFVYAHQVDDEQRHETVKYRNGVGFNLKDAKIGSSFAKWYQSKGFFTAKQMSAVKRMVVKYAGQVVEVKIREGEIRQLDHGVWVW